MLMICAGKREDERNVDQLNDMRPGRRAPRIADRKTTNKAGRATEEKDSARLRQADRQISRQAGGQCEVAG